LTHIRKTVCYSADNPKHYRPQEIALVPDEFVFILVKAGKRNEGIKTLYNREPPTTRRQAMRVAGAAMQAAAHSNAHHQAGIAGK
jgi:hypothetical protein